MADIVKYIAHVLNAPDTARKWLANMKTEINSLSQMPERIKLTSEEPWHSKGIHKMNVRNYFVYFRIDKENSDVWVVAVVYSGMNQANQLDMLNLN
jgi:toxin ParE1/3/4